MRIALLEMVEYNPDIFLKPSDPSNQTIRHTGAQTMLNKFGAALEKSGSKFGKQHLDWRDVDDLAVAEAHAGFVQQPGDRHFKHHRLHNAKGSEHRNISVSMAFTTCLA